MKFIKFIILLSIICGGIIYVIYQHCDFFVYLNDASNLAPGSEVIWCNQTIGHVSSVQLKHGRYCVKVRLNDTYQGTMRYGISANKRSQNVLTGGSVLEVYGGEDNNLPYLPIWSAEIPRAPRYKNMLQSLEDLTCQQNPSPVSSKGQTSITSEIMAMKDQLLDAPATQATCSNITNQIAKTFHKVSEQCDAAFVTIRSALNDLLVSETSPLSATMDNTNTESKRKEVIIAN